MNSVFQWIRTHKVRTVLILVLLFVLIEIASIPWFSVSRLKSSNPGETALMAQRRREAEGEGKSYTISQRWIPLSRLPRSLIDAVVVAEDGTFYSHGGFDWFEVRESINKNLQTKRVARGGSTITQQLAKNLYLSTSKDPLRKMKEAVITLLLEGSLSKDRILEIYLNVIEWGRGVFGVDAAARTFFGKSASALTLEESTRLAAVIPSPLRHRPSDDSRYVLRRKQIVLNRMLARSMGSTESLEGEEDQLNSDEESAASPGTEIGQDTTRTDSGGVNGF